MSRARRPLGLLLVPVVVLLCGLGAALAEDAPSDLIAQADAAYLLRYELASLQEAFDLYEAVLADLESLPIETQAHVLNRLCELCYELAMFSEGNTPEDEALFKAGKDYGFRSLRLNEDFASRESAGLEFALQYATEDDATAMHWLANAWGMVLEMNPILGLVEQSSVMLLFERTVEVDETFWGASSMSALGSLLVMVPGIMGGNQERGLTLIESSIELDPDYLHNRIILAEYWGFTYNMLGAVTGVRDADLIERECALVLEGEIGDWPFWNRQAKLEAERLLQQLADWTD